MIHKEVPKRQRKNIYYILLIIGTVILFTYELSLNVNTFNIRTFQWLSFDINPFPINYTTDKIFDQLAYVPPDYNESAPEKIIFILADSNGLGRFAIHNGNISFENCPVKRCSITTTSQANVIPDAVIYKHVYNNTKVPSSPRQVKIFFTQESPYHISKFAKPSIINWTVTYREDSDIPVPYGKWMNFQDNHEINVTSKNYAANKTKKVAWFVSNCNAKNSRLQYGKRLRHFIDVDIYGKCGDKTCVGNKCFDLLSDYKFYLSFENSNCQDYVTEKFFYNALQHDILPIVMGAPLHYYEKIAPNNSFIHVDHFDSVESLANYLKKLDKDDNLYNSYFKWKGTGKLVDERFWCRLCSLLHSPFKEKTYPDINKWWRRRNICTDTEWNYSLMAWQNLQIFS